ncbi:hypothetical protein ScPMuIL_000138 [Solemya velum]
MDCVKIGHFISIYSAESLKKSSQELLQRLCESELVTTGMRYLRWMFVIPLYLLGFLSRCVEKLLFIFVSLYDDYVYSPLQAVLSPLVANVPRKVSVNSRTYTVFTANIVSWARTTLVIPIACCLKYDLNVLAFGLVLLHDFLDHLDGIVAKVQKQMHGAVDDSLLGGFMDAFCDKIVNFMALWTILLYSDFSRMTWSQGSLLFLSCAVIMAYEFILGVVRVQDYFRAYYERKYKKTDVVPMGNNIASVMEGKLKEKLESLGIGFLCLAQSSTMLMESACGICGVVCLVLSVRLAHASLQHKLQGRLIKEEKENQLRELKAKHKSKLRSKVSHIFPEKRYNNVHSLHFRSDNRIDSLDILQCNNTKASVIRRFSSVPSSLSTRVDKVYTIGCFDLFHKGHIRLLQRMREFGKQIIVGVHDSRSIFKLKKRVPIESTEARMEHVKQHADVVFCVAGTNPTAFLSYIVDRSEQATSMYIRGDDMPNFPARDLCERLMPIHFLPYTQEISSTKVRLHSYNASPFGPHGNNDDMALFY